MHTLIANSGIQIFTFPLNTNTQERIKLKKKKIVVIRNCIISLSFLGLILCSSCGNPRSVKQENEDNAKGIKIEKKEPITYNFYVENSGSVKGYFKGNTNDAGNILKEFYDRIEENKGGNDTISLNFINNEIIPQKTAINKWLNQIYVNCNSSYSDIDKVLEQTLLATNDNTINILLSDYCFESQFGNLDKAKSEITKIFTKGINKYNDLSIAIYKYEASFDGYYFPGKIKFNGKRPLYLWIFGPSRKVKDVTNLPITLESEAKMFLQPMEVCTTMVATKNARMTDKGKNIIVKHWKEDRYEDNLYKVDIIVDLSKVIISDSEIKDITKYTIAPNEYYIDNIKSGSKGQYIYTIATNQRPFACDLVIGYTTKLPDWVITSNFENNSLPKDSTTYGIKSLIEGVNNAYRNKYKNIFTINLSLK